MSDEHIAKGNCLIVFTSKRSVEFGVVNGAVSSFAVRGFYFDKISRVAFDDSAEIVRALTDGAENYDNVVIYCPSVMEQTIKNFIVRLKSGVFDGTGQLNCGSFSAFLLVFDGECFLTPDKISDVLEKKYDIKYESAFVKTVGAPQKLLAEALADAREACADIEFNVRESFGDCTIEMVYSDRVLKSEFDRAHRCVLAKLNDYIYALEDITPSKRLYDLLKLRRMKISVAESFTGGGVGMSLVGVPGVSEVYEEGLNTYSNEAKMGRLGVKAETLRSFGAVSEEVAAEMAEGLIKGGGCDVAISTTGIAGPASDNTHKPVGLMYIGIATKDKVSVYKYELNGDRENITRTAINLALFLAFKIIK